MKQVAVNMKLDLIAAISCADLLSSQGIDTTQQPISTTVRVTLETLTEFLREGNNLPSYDESSDETLIARFNELFKEQISEVKNLDFSGLKEFRRKSDKQADLSRMDIAKEVERTIDKASIPNISRTSEEYETEDIPRKRDIFKIETELTFGEIREIAPSNGYVEGLCKSPDPLVQKAVEICFSSFPEEQWGEVYIDDVIRQLIEEHEDEK